MSSLDTRSIAVSLDQLTWVVDTMMNGLDSDDWKEYPNCTVNHNDKLGVALSYSTLTKKMDIIVNN